jgi:hypothetical protein
MLAGSISTFTMNVCHFSGFRRKDLQKKSGSIKKSFQRYPDTKIQKIDAKMLVSGNGEPFTL